MVGRAVLLIGGQGKDPSVGEENKKKTCSATANLIRKVPSESYIPSNSTKPSKVPSQENQVLLLEVSEFMLTTCIGDMDELVAARQSSLGRGDRIRIKYKVLDSHMCRCKVHKELRSMCWSETDYVPSNRATCTDLQSLHRS